MQKAGYLDRGVAVDPVSRAAAADTFAGLGEIFGRDTEAVGIVGDVTVRAVLAALQHLNKTVHEVRVRVAQVVLLVVEHSACARIPYSYSTAPAAAG